MRISDWSSDVCSSDLDHVRAQRPDQLVLCHLHLSGLAGGHQIGLSCPSCRCDADVPGISVPRSDWPAVSMTNGRAAMPIRPEAIITSAGTSTSPVTTILHALNEGALPPAVKTLVQAKRW